MRLNGHVEVEDIHLYEHQLKRASWPSTSRVQLPALNFNKILVNTHTATLLAEEQTRQVCDRGVQT